MEKGNKIKIIQSAIIFFVGFLFVDNISADSLISETELSSTQIAALGPSLSAGSRNRIDNYINSVPIERRLNYLNRILSKIDILINNIEASETSELKKTYKVKILLEIKDIINNNIDELEDMIPVISLSGSGYSNGTASIILNTNSSGKGYYVVLPSGSSAPSVNQVKSGTDSSGYSAIRGNWNLNSGSNQFTITGLSANTNYVLYVVTENSDGVLQQSILSSPFQTTNTSSSGAPTFSLALNSTTNSTATIGVNINESAKGYYIILPSGSTAPTSSQIRLGTDSSGNNLAMSGNLNLSSGLNQINVFGLNANTNYVLYFTAEDSDGNIQQNVSNVPFLTVTGSQTNQPITLSTAFVTNSSASINIQASESLTGYYVVLPSNSTAPTSSQIRSGTDSSGNIADLKGTFNIVSGNNGLNVGGLNSNMNYIIYLTTVDGSGNLRQTPSYLNFTTSM